MESAFRIGIAEVDCTPPLGLPIMGHFRDDYGATGVHDPLNVRAIVFADRKGCKVAIVTIDVCMLGREQVTLFREYVHTVCGIPKEHIFVAATHTHGSIATKSLYVTPRASDKDIEQFLRGAVESVIKADSTIQAGILEIGHTAEERISFNRRLCCQDQSTHMNWEEIDPVSVIGTLGPIDPEVKTISVRSNNRSSACVVNFALHPAILDYENSLYTADYVGYLSEALKEINGENFISLFFNGCCGNINHINYADKDSPRRGYAMAQRIGYMLAAKVSEASRESAPLSGDVLRVSRELVGVERFKISKELYEQSKKFLSSGRDKNYQQIDGLDLKYGAPLWVRMYEQQNQADNVEVMVIRIGDAAIVGLPGEVFCELGLAIKQQSPARHTLVVELANDAAGYFPTQQAFEEGGYEVMPGATNYEADSGGKLVASALRQLKALFEK